ncbi:NADH-quinone oxidoreductase subunit L [Oceanimonas sp. CHS3-5]|uniref:NADH-quinone oxidoreductase subunit L n=1 Tax=Oceanimonas sp. CHS3-5 TaxID=3068186 RepID=UPI00273E5884|nr:NADH-quinone oxidoreductase subunit L [Oceanimonas sp. CHS3-5]MDP5292078.1 NADH-quinone oxidoreductase subunit L [Oceanimonas sp. CHS3-5]
MPFVLSGAALAACYLVGWLACMLSRQHHWRIARLSSRLALAASLLVPALQWGLTRVTPPGLPVVMGMLVAVLGWVIVGYASRYLRGEPRQALFVRAIMFTLSSVTVLVASRHLAVMALAWSGTSIGLHYLLTYYAERKTGQIVAHKKFLVSRMAELCLLGALVLIYSSVGSLSVDVLNAQLAAAESLPLALHGAAVLIALAAVLKSAQLPLHGWLIQVMEAPTPVSALLHAGVVNIGGFVLITLASLIALAPAAQYLLVIVGSLTAVLAGWVMMTRISIKVRLAWSTCAQMGFMLVEIGLGLYELALLHLLAHSIYKAHAFLAVGEAVEHARLKDYRPHIAGVRGGVSALLMVAALVAMPLLLWQLWVPALTLPLAAVAILVLGLAPLLWHGPRSLWPRLGRGALQVLALLHLYLLWHWLVAGLAPASAPASPLLLAWTLLAFVLLYAAQVAVSHHGQHPLVQRMYPWAYNGFYLDETFTRITFKIWPARLSPLQAQTRVNRHTNELGETA